MSELDPINLTGWERTGFVAFAGLLTHELMSDMLPIVQLDIETTEQGAVEVSYAGHDSFFDYVRTAVAVGIPVTASYFAFRGTRAQPEAQSA